MTIFRDLSFHAVRQDRLLELLRRLPAELVDPLIDVEQQKALALALALLVRDFLIRDRDFFLGRRDVVVERLQLFFERGDIGRRSVFSLALLQSRGGLLLGLLEIFEAVLQPFRLNFEKRISRRVSARERKIARQRKIRTEFGRLRRGDEILTPLPHPLGHLGPETLVPLGPHALHLELHDLPSLGKPPRRQVVARADDQEGLALLDAQIMGRVGVAGAGADIAVDLDQMVGADMLGP